MKTEDIEKLKSQIKKGGFPFELEVAHEFANKGWSVENNTYYVDKDENKGREIDLIADYVKMFETPEKHYTECTFSFVTEIKKEKDKPWVIFTTETTNFEKMIYDIFVDKIYNNFDKKILSKSFKKHNQVLHDRLGRSFTEGFSQGRDKIFTSLCNVTKAFISKLEDREKPGSTDSILYYYEPLIILSGQLFEAFLDENKELVVEKREHMQMRFNYMSDYYKERTNGYIINIVTQDFLPTFIDFRSSKFDKIFKEIKHGI
jgi:hypothetical protein